jgi:hypothetical protein
VDMNARQPAWPDRDGDEGQRDRTAGHRAGDPLSRSGRSASAGPRCLRRTSRIAGPATGSSGKATRHFFTSVLRAIARQRPPAGGVEVRSDTVSGIGSNDRHRDRVARRTWQLCRSAETHGDLACRRWDDGDAGGAAGVAGPV